MVVHYSLYIELRLRFVVRFFLKQGPGNLFVKDFSHRARQRQTVIPQSLFHFYGGIGHQGKYRTGHLLYYAGRKSPSRQFRDF